jgi:hypothetical protein
VHDPVIVSDHDECASGAGLLNMFTGVRQPPALVSVANPGTHVTREIATGFGVIDARAFIVFGRNSADEVHRRLAGTHVRVLRQEAQQGFFIQEGMARRAVMAAEPFADAAHFAQQGGKRVVERLSGG